MVATEFEAAVDVAEWIDRQAISRVQIVVVCLCAACAMMEGLDAQLIGYVAPAIIRAWQLPAQAFTPAFMSGLAGLLVGCLVVAPIADRIGRKAVLIGTVATFSVFSLLTAASSNITELCVLRFLTGLGIGGGMANAIALTFEFFPRHRRAAMTVLMFAGFPLGAALGGFASAYLIGRFGWQSVFLFGGTAPAILAALLAIVLPDSFRHLVARHEGTARVAAILNRINPAAGFTSSTHFTISEERKPGWTVTHLFKEGRFAGTVLIWVVFFMSLLDIFLISSWLPTILSEAKVPMEISVLITSSTQSSGVLACILVAPILSRGNPFVVLIPAYILAAIGNAALGSVGTGIAPLLVAACASGAGIVAGQVTANAFAATFYPTYIRATGVGWALGIGRIGAIVGPAIGGSMLAMHLSRQTIFLVSAVPAVIAVVAVVGLMWLPRLHSRSAPLALGSDAEVRSSGVLHTEGVNRRTNQGLWSFQRFNQSRKDPG